MSRKVDVIQRIEWVCNTIFHQLVVVYCFYHFWLIFNSFPSNHTRLWHIFLSTAAYFPLMAEGIILFFESNVWSQQIDRIKKCYVHGVILLISTALLTAGIIFEIYAKDQRGAEHFKSDHAITGLVSWILSIISILLGFLSCKLDLLKKYFPPVVMKLFHNFLGIVSFGLGITSLSLGFFLGDFIFFTGISENEQIFAVILIAIMSLWSIRNALKQLYIEAKAVFCK